jgi:hypothetical protein
VAEIFKRKVERASDLIQPGHGNVGPAEFDVGEKTRGERGFPGDLGEGHGAASAGGAKIFAELLQIGSRG